MSEEQNQPFFGKQNFILMLAGVLIICLGFLLMSGGGTPLNTEHVATEFDKEGLFSFRRITLAPIVITIGFIIEVIAIFKRPKQA